VTLHQKNSQNGGIACACDFDRTEK